MGNSRSNSTKKAKNYEALIKQLKKGDLVEITIGKHEEWVINVKLTDEYREKLSKVIQELIDTEVAYCEVNMNSF
jgi:DNA-binding MarR family transcriptional regulator